MKYTVTFVPYYTHMVDTEDEDKSFDGAYKEFKSDMYCSVANAYYDNYEVECKDEGEDE